MKSPAGEAGRGASGNNVGLAELRAADSLEFGMQSLQPSSLPVAEANESDLEEMLEDMKAEVLAQSIADIVAEFPNINQNVAEMTLKAQLRSLPIGFS